MSLMRSATRGRFSRSLSVASPAAAYIAAVEATGVSISAPQEAAITSFIDGEIAAGRWDGIKRLYFPVWGVAAANAICMKSLTSATFFGGMTHGAGYIYSGLVNTYMQIDTDLLTLGLSIDSYHSTALCLTAPGGNYKTLLAGPLEMSYGDEAYLHRLGISNSYNLNLDAQDMIGILSFGGNRTSRYSKIRNTFGLNSLSISQASAVGEFLSTVPRYLTNTTGGNQYFGQLGQVSLGTAMSDAQDTAYTAALETLWETVTGLTLP